jgi:hypothetical protein
MILSKTAGAVAVPFWKGTSIEELCSEVTITFDLEIKVTDFRFYLELFTKSA